MLVKLNGDDGTQRHINPAHVVAAYPKSTQDGEPTAEGSIVELHGGKRFGVREHIADVVARLNNPSAGPAPIPPSPLPDPPRPFDAEVQE